MNWKGKHHDSHGNSRCQQVAGSLLNSGEPVLYLLERHDEIELLRIVAGVLEARAACGFASGQVRRAIARVEQGS
jgi:hypothetical protein